MNLAVLVKHVPDTAEADLAVAEGGKALKASQLPFQMNEWDRFALEEAVQLKEKTSGTLTAFLFGSEEDEESLRRCLAVGADRAVRVWDASLAGGGPLVAARLLDGAMGEEKFDLVLAGAQSSDDGYGLVGPALAHLRGLPAVTLVNALEIEGGKATCTRELEAGMGEVTEVALPALITIQTGINEPRYVSVLGIKKARTRPIDTPAPAPSAEEIAELSGKLKLTALEPPPALAGAEIWTGSFEEIAGRFVTAMGEAGGLK